MEKTLKNAEKKIGKKTRQKEGNTIIVTIGKIHTQKHRHRQTKEQNAGFVGWETGSAPLLPSDSSPATV